MKVEFESTYIKKLEEITMKNYIYSETIDTLTAQNAIVIFRKHIAFDATTEIALNGVKFINAVKAACDMGTPCDGYKYALQQWRKSLRDLQTRYETEVVSKREFALFEAVRDGLVKNGYPRTSSIRGFGDEDMFTFKYPNFSTLPEVKMFESLAKNMANRAEDARIEDMFRTFF